MSLLDQGGLGEDGRLPSERALSEGFGIARRRIRQALAGLETEGLIWRKRGAGAFAGSAIDPTAELAARSVGETNAIQVMEARLCIEPELAALCARRIERAAVDRLRSVADRIRVKQEDRENEIWNNGDWLRFRARVRTHASAAQAIREHARIIDAIAARDADAARAAVRLHLDRRLRALLAEATKPGETS